MKNKINSGSYSNSLKLDYITQFNEFFGVQTTKNRRAIEKLDLLLLAIEAIDINASLSLASISNSVELNHIFPNYVEIWKSRCHNPMRKSTRAAPITTDSFEALISLISKLSQRFYPKIRNLLSSSSSKLYSRNSWDEFTSRFEDLISERLNSRRISVRNYMNYSENTHDFYKNLLLILALCSGEAGEIRLRSIIFEPLSLLKSQ